MEDEEERGGRGEGFKEGVEEGEEGRFGEGEGTAKVEVLGGGLAGEGERRGGTHVARVGGEFAVATAEVLLYDWGMQLALCSYRVGPQKGDSLTC